MAMPKKADILSPLTEEFSVKARASENVSLLENGGQC